MAGVGGEGGGGAIKAQSERTAVGIRAASEREVGATGVRTASGTATGYGGADA